jgi:hypothetical protein
VFAAKLINPSVSFAAALQGHTDEKTNEEENRSASKRDFVHPNNRKQINQFQLPV